jgi:hypothetical protein
LNAPRREPGFLRRLMIPSFASAGVHLALLAAVLAATITIAGRDKPRERLTEIAVEAAGPATLQEPAPEAASLPDTGARASTSLPVKPAPMLTGESLAAPISPEPLPASSAQALVREEPEVARTVSFAGVQAQAARRIVYVVDASGSMVNSYAFIRARLIQSINRLSPTQKFTIILARTQPDGTGVTTMPAGDDDVLVRALPAKKVAAVKWLRKVVVGGRSAPLTGLEAALAMDPKPDLVFLLSRGFRRTDSGGAWTGIETALARLDTLNPRSKRTGDRPVVVKTLQFLDEDPTGLMQAIGEAQGDGPGSFRVLTIDDLAMTEEDALPEDEPGDRSLDQARKALAEADGAALDVLYGFASPESRASVQAAIADARAALGPRLGAMDTTGASIRVRTDLLEAALSGDASLAGQVRDALADMFVVEPEADAARRLAFACASALAGDFPDAQAAADELETDLTPLGLSPAIRSELGVLRVRFGLEGRTQVGSEWSLLKAKAATRAALAVDGMKPGVFDPLFDWANEDTSRRSRLWQLVAAVTDTYPAEAVVEPRVRFARAMGLAGVRPDEAIGILLSLAAAEPGTDLGREALWEGAVLLAWRDPARAGDALAQFAKAWPRDARATDALVAAIAHTPTNDAASLRERLRNALIELPDHPDADLWRVRLAGLSPQDQALVLLGQVNPDSSLADRAADLVFDLARRSDTGATSLRMGSRLLRSFDDPRWQHIHAALVEQLIASDPARSAIEAQRLDTDVPEYALLLARAQLAAGQRDAGLQSLEILTGKLSPESDLFWRCWALMLDALSEDPTQDDVIRAHLYRLRLIDPDFDTNRWDAPTKNLADAPTDP